MQTYPINTDLEQIEYFVGQLTAKGRETMEAVGKGELSFFDDGIVEHSGIWGEALVAEMGHKSSGVVNRLRDLGLWNATDHGGEDGPEAGMWWSLTALGADVANYLAGRLETQAEDTPEQAETTALPAVKTGAKWTYLYAADGTLIAELRNDQFEAIAQHLANGKL